MSRAAKRDAVCGPIPGVRVLLDEMLPVGVVDLPPDDDAPTATAAG